MFAATMMPTPRSAALGASKAAATSSTQDKATEGAGTATVRKKFPLDKVTYMEVNEEKCTCTIMSKGDHVDFLFYSELVTEMIIDMLCFYKKNNLTPPKVRTTTSFAEAQQWQARLYNADTQAVTLKKQLREQTTELKAARGLAAEEAAKAKALELQVKQLQEELQRNKASAANKDCTNACIIS